MGALIPLLGQCVLGLVSMHQALEMCARELLIVFSLDVPKWPQS